MAALPSEVQRLPADLWTIVLFIRRRLFNLGSDGPRSYGRNHGTKFSVREDGAISRYVADVASLRPSDFIGRHRDVLLIEEADPAAERDALRAVREAERLVHQAARAVNYFQIHDIKRHWKILERRVLAAVLDFLEENGIDTAEYNSHVTQILNNGTIINGSVTGSNFGPGNVVNAGSESKPANANG